MFEQPIIGAIVEYRYDKMLVALSYLISVVSQRLGLDHL